MQNYAAYTATDRFLIVVVLICAIGTIISFVAFDPEDLETTQGVESTGPD